MQSEESNSNEQIRQLHQKVATLQAQNEALFKEFQATQATHLLASHNYQAPRIKDTLPPVYTGRNDNRHSVAGWLCKARSLLDIHQLGLTKEGIHYVVGQLEGPILSWYIVRPCQKDESGSRQRNESGREEGYQEHRYG